MRVLVSEILKEPGASEPFDLTEEMGDIDAPGGVVKVCGPLHVKGVATSLGDGIYVEADVRGFVRLTCSRCLSPFERPIKISCEGKFLERPEADEAETEQEEEDSVEVFPLSGAYCDLDEMVRHEIVLDIPMKPLCKEDCKGLCPTCGKNLNEGDCDCPKPGRAPTAFGRKLLQAMDERSRKNGPA